MKKLLILGCSGSIGSQTVDVCRAHPEELRVMGVGIGVNYEALEGILKEFTDIEYVYSKERLLDLELNYPHIRFYHGEQGLIEIVKEESYDTLINAMVSDIGLKPTYEAILHKKDIALANKETLVIAGEVIMKAIRENGVRLYPIDSEHSAIWQCLNGNSRKDVKKLIITGSGGSFRNLERSELGSVTVEDALKHPNWKMGAKITVDSATMMNKGFEIMEAHYLFGIDYDHIDVLLHDESIVHSLVEYKDGSIMAQLSTPDMHLPIQYALLAPKHADFEFSESLDLAKVGTLHFKEMDYVRYPLVYLVKKLARFGGNIGAIINGANDECVKLFLEGRISFLDIEKGVNEALRNIKVVKNCTLDQLMEYNAEAKAFVNNYFTVR